MAEEIPLPTKKYKIMNINIKSKAFPQYDYIVKHMKTFGQHSFVGETWLKMFYSSMKMCFDVFGVEQVTQRFNKLTITIRHDSYLDNWNFKLTKYD